MSRSNPTEGVKNPSTRWFEWAGGADGGFVRFYDKNTEQHVKVDLPFTFLLLDELATVKGWHEPSESSIYSNEVRDTRQDVLVVRSFKGGELASGLYTAIRDSIVAKGGHFCMSLYIAYKDESGMSIGNINLKGAALSAWMDFKKSAPSRKDANGKNVRGYYVDAVKIASFEQAKKGGTVYRVPTFVLAPVSAETNESALALDAELQSFLTDYLKRPKSEASKPVTPTDADLEAASQAEHAPAFTPTKPGHFDDLVDDIPF